MTRDAGCAGGQGISAEVECAGFDCARPATMLLRVLSGPHDGRSGRYCADCARARAAALCTVCDLVLTPLAVAV